MVELKEHDQGGGLGMMAAWSSKLLSVLFCNLDRVVSLQLRMEGAGVGFMWLVFG